MQEGMFGAGSAALSQSLPGASLTSPTGMMIRQREDYPKVPFWRKRDWLQNPKAVQEPGKRVQRGGTRAANGINVTMRYITDTDGNVIDGYRASAIRKSLRLFCIFLWNEHRAPKSWKRGADAWVTERYYAWMTSRHPELQFCEDNWWAEQVAVDNYSQWRRKYISYLAKEEKKKLKKNKNKEKKKKSKKAQKRSGIQDLTLVLSDQEAAEPSVQSEDDSHDTINQLEEEESAQAVSAFLTSSPLYTIEPWDNTPPPAASSANSSHESAGPPAKKPRLSIDTSVVCVESSHARHESLPSVNAAASLSHGETSVVSSASGESLPAYDTPDDGRDVPNPFANMWDSEVQNQEPVEGTASASAPAAEPCASTASNPTPSTKAAGKRPAVWPPPPSKDGSKAKPKDLCACIWADLNPNGTKKEFDEWYKGISQSARAKYIKGAAMHTT
ncbi:hypothetical protein BN946_scf184876.g15 [Trametes cinnabarina]|uniref:Uncharacterized protein n=1 Tax=Pycnoporus cinnabarinus TaxID=5643 RepID=A0A060SNK7_PYCCI|nr:hypothetical protein BN946_scf184876.g15 [Trametes cinnabarina]